METGRGTSNHDWFGRWGYCDLLPGMYFMLPGIALCCHSQAIGSFCFFIWLFLYCRYSQYNQIAYTSTSLCCAGVAIKLLDQGRFVLCDFASHAELYELTADSIKSRNKWIECIKGKWISTKHLFVRLAMYNMEHQSKCTKTDSDHSVHFEKYTSDTSTRFDLFSWGATSTRQKQSMLTVFHTHCFSKSPSNKRTSSAGCGALRKPQRGPKRNFPPVMSSEVSLSFCPSWMLSVHRDWHLFHWGYFFFNSQCCTATTEDQPKEPAENRTHGEISSEICHGGKWHERPSIGQYCH